MLISPVESSTTSSMSDNTGLMSSLWNVDDQTSRLNELTSQDTDLKEAPLRRDVRSLGRLLGEVLKEQAGDELFSAVEELRTILIQHRESESQRVDLIKRADEIVVGFCEAGVGR